MKVWNAERTVKKFVFDVQSFEDLLKKGALDIVFVTTCASKQDNTIIVKVSKFYEQHIQLFLYKIAQVY